MLCVSMLAVLTAIIACGCVRSLLSLSDRGVVSAPKNIFTEFSSGLCMDCRLSLSLIYASRSVVLQNRSLMSRQLFLVVASVVCAQQRIVLLLLIDLTLLLTNLLNSMPSRRVFLTMVQSFQKRHVTTSAATATGPLKGIRFVHQQFINANYRIFYICHCSGHCYFESILHIAHCSA